MMDIKRAKSSKETILSCVKLKKYFRVRGKFFNLKPKWVKAVNDVSIDIQRGETLGMVGESGCGKSTFAKTIAGIYQPTEGKIYFKGEEVSLKNKNKSFWRDIQYLHQDPASSLDPWWEIGRTIKEPLKIHCNELSDDEMNHEAKNILKFVGLKEEYFSRYPHELSCGQQRRVGLARILILKPKVIIFDEPTAGLDVSLQGTILKLLEKIKNQFNLTYIIISHNLVVVCLVSDRIAVTYLGNVVEIGETKTIWEEPLHPYTKMLFSALPKIEIIEDEQGIESSQVESIVGEIPDPQISYPGCSFEPRCSAAKDICKEKVPVLKDVSKNHMVSCHFF